MKTYAEKLIDSKSKTELDLDFPHYGENDERNEVMVPHRCISLSVDTPSMDIDDAINILEELKKKGSNRVYIMNHCDHRGYYFFGVKLIEL